ncbi:MAG: riboflavin synthase [Crocinitomicaceae bacterium]|nr:riboflavin synthase [Crocinitomicaceae bacterium]
MFTGIIEQLGTVRNITKDGDNIHFELAADFVGELKIDQSVAHNGCCLTVVQLTNDTYTVTAIKETLDRTNLSSWTIGTKVNLERCMVMNGRIDGHIVQGHVDTTATCVGIEPQNGSWKFIFSYETPDVTVEKGSVTVNGTSLTVVDSNPQSFSVCIIPYTFEYTNFNQLKIGDKVNIEFDIIGKYVAKLIGNKA